MVPMDPMYQWLQPLPADRVHQPGLEDQTVPVVLLVRLRH